MKRFLPILFLASLLFAPSAWAWLPYTAMFKAFKDPRPYTAQASDKRTALAVKTALLASSFGTGLDVSVECYLGRVFLAGEVPDEAAQAQARQLASVQSGVRSVEAFLPVKGQTPGDASALAVRKALLGEEGGEALTLSVKAVGGVAVLMGVASSAEARDQAAAVAAQVPGVTGVRNFLFLPEAGEEKRQGPAKRVLGRVLDR